MTESFVDYVRDQLRRIPNLTFRRMFGGYGIYSGNIFFAILYSDRLYFKTDEESRKTYKAFGMEPFRPSAKQTLKNYFELPADVLEDADELTKWAHRSLAAGNRAASSPSTARRIAKTAKTRGRSKRRAR